MMYGVGRRIGGRGGMGFGFRGSSPPWPYVGRGRGGLPRCRYPGLVSGSPYIPVSPYSPDATREQELEYLTEQTATVKRELERMEARIRDLEAGD